ncbi:cuticle protein 8 [Procambarus clarkii]|uniref:cuticle protein 8 n=1 Tax=Procambarus clarkii TaxID=6728 RepID=UPI001E6723A8|nr:pro-resilin-like [Procambarus clarkii]
MKYTVILLACLVVLATGRPQEENYPPAKYNFEYAVEDPESGNSYSHKESRDGDDTEGRYEVLLPDTRRQIVVYTVNADGGFNADVTYEGEAVLKR